VRTAHQFAGGEEKKRDWWACCPHPHTPFCLPRKGYPQRGHPRITGLRLPCAIGYSRRGNKLALRAQTCFPYNPADPLCSAACDGGKKWKTNDIKRYGRE
jgi:hypothetical protein